MRRETDDRVHEVVHLFRRRGCADQLSDDAEVLLDAAPWRSRLPLDIEQGAGDAFDRRCNSRGVTDGRLSTGAEADQDDLATWEESVGFVQGELRGIVVKVRGCVDPVLRSLLRFEGERTELCE